MAEQGPPAGLYKRKASLVVVAPKNGNNPSAFEPIGKALDLSQFQFRFQTSQEDWESPSNCAIRVYNLAPDTVRKIQQEYSRVVVNAGYEHGPFGVIFDGQIKQFRIGREDNMSTYLDILAADGDVSYNWAIVRKSLAAGSKWADQVVAISDAMKKTGGVELGQVIYPDAGGILPRGKVLFGYAKAQMRSVAQSMGSSWSIQNGRINIIPLDGYLPGEAVVLNSTSGLIGRPEQTQEGIKAKCLLNPRITIGGTVKIDNKSINKTEAQKDNVIPGAQLAYNQWTGIEQLATVTADGLYRVYVAEHVGNTRGLEWHTNIICLTVNPVTQKVKPYGT